MKVQTSSVSTCKHCGERCTAHEAFCCNGCRMVYELLQEHDLCTYYSLNEKPGHSQRVSVRSDKFAFLDDEHIQQRLIRYQDDIRDHVTFYLPAIHCSSCLWLLEHLNQLDSGVERVEVHFTRKEASIVYQKDKSSLRSIAETLTSIGYEPYISLQDLDVKTVKTNRQLIYQVGVAGFCFANIMLLSFPEYFSGEKGMDSQMSNIFRYLNLALALPVFLYSAQPFFRSAWKGLKNGFINIDTPIVLAIITTFIRSFIDILSGTGAGFFDSMTGIVLFMLTGRILQEKTYQGLSFDRDYTSYFPISVSVIKSGQSIPTPLPSVKTGDTLLVHHQELIPADGILSKGKALIDYSFVTGESMPVEKQTGEIIYAGGRQLSGNIELLTIREVAQSYLTDLWNRDEMKRQPEHASFIHVLGKSFGWIVLSIAAITAIYWSINDPARIWPSVTAVLIVACPCALLLTASFTNGHILRILSRHQLFLRNAETIETLAATDHIVFDKTGTLTEKDGAVVRWYGRKLQRSEIHSIGALAGQSQHPASRALRKDSSLLVKAVIETPGHGICGSVNGNHHIRLGNAGYSGGPADLPTKGTTVHVNINGVYAGYYTISNRYRFGIVALLKRLRFPMSVLSGDNAHEAPALRQMMGPDAELRFLQQPADKLAYIQTLQQQGKQVLMIGDGLNDAGALRQSNTGLSIAEDINNFTPASDGILAASRLYMLPAFIRLCQVNKKIIVASFIYSILYNLTGLYFAVQGILSPLMAAILMPASSISIILLTYCCSEWAGRRLQTGNTQKIDQYHTTD
ncbi:heavy metal translocating P-type ATPase [Chitinophaga pendula]|uniref:heavy metal translocating P-type ATPase n=1 Tax=Chitinophaga TaxID=79328 RepID=UPI000BAF39FA|nr:MULTISPECIES: heavy metal translocating P-type ATPase metal-binding domain-containing protein [Chitinophaga]ASZ14362.1 heavy metal translocating P-type ATPase [Chitinophaga sp. MD30]UCJ07989.1 heavy metal translocating P-type ATPase [Chitinophaga pendula]